MHIDTTLDQLHALANHVIRDCSDIDGADRWQADQARNTQEALEQLADRAGDHGMSQLQSAALDVYAYMSAFTEDHRPPSPQQRLQLQQLSQAISRELPQPSVSSALRVLAMLPGLPGQADRMALASRLQQARIAIEFVDEGDQLDAALRHEPPQLLLVETGLVAAVAELLDRLAEQISHAVRIPILSCGLEAGSGQRLRALADGADAHLECLHDLDLAECMTAAASPNSAEPYRVLIVDDDRQLAMYCQRVLSRAGMQAQYVTAAHSVEAAVADFAPDLVLMDLYQPECDGLQLTTQLRAHSNALLLPIVFLSGEYSSDARFQAIAAGGDDFLTKPVRPRHLIAAVRSRIQRVRQLSRQIAAAAPKSDREGHALRKAEFLEVLAAEVALPDRHLLAIAIDQWDQGDAHLDLSGRHALEVTVLDLLAAQIGVPSAISLWRDGGYGVLLRNCTAKQARAQADRLRDAVAQAGLTVGADSGALTVSIGLVGHDHDLDCASWIRTAQVALSTAMQQGGNRIETITMRSEWEIPAERLVWLRKRIDEARQGRGVLIEFQPILPLRGNRAGAYQLRMSLNDHGGSLEGAGRDEYEPVASCDGTIAELERIALTRAVESLDHLSKQGLPVDIHVPIDLTALCHQQLAWLESLLAGRAQLARHLTLEFDAATLLSRPALLAVVRHLRTFGMRVLANSKVDLLSGLARMRQLPVDGARFQIRALPEGQDHSVAQQVSAWHALDRTVLLDGVDSVAHLTRLWNLGVDDLQGAAIGAATAMLDFEFGRAM